MSVLSVLTNVKKHNKNNQTLFQKLSGTRTGLKMSENVANVQRKPLKDLQKTQWKKMSVWKLNVKK